MIKSESPFVCVTIAALLFSYVTIAFADTDIQPNKTVFYQITAGDGKITNLQVQVLVRKRKVSGFREKALYIKVNGNRISPDQLIVRKPIGKVKGGKACTFVHSDGGISVPLSPSVEAFDSHEYYALASGQSMPLYQFNLEGLVLPGNNIIELSNADKDQMISVEFVKYNGKTLTPLKELPLQKASANVMLPKISTPFFPISKTPAKGNEKAFSIGEGSDTQIEWRGELLVSSEKISFYPDEKISEKTEKTVVKNTDDWKTVNTWSSNEHLPFRKEVAVSKNGNEVELNFRLNHPAYHQKEGIGVIGYSIQIPIKTLIGMNYTGFGGRGNSPVPPMKGTLTDKTPNKSLFRTGVRYLAFEDGKRKIVFDFNPEGVQTWGDYGPGYIQGLWSIAKTPTHLRFSFGTTNREHGGVIHSKVRIFEGTAETYLDRHAQKKYAYFSELPADLRFCFGAPKHGLGFIQAGTARYDETKGFGWSREVDLDSARASGALFTAAHSKKAATFQARVSRPGLYILTLRSAAYQNKRGAFSLTSNGKAIVTDLSIDPFTVKNISWSQWLENGKIELKFSGKEWAVSSLGIQMLQHSLEDFKFRRGFWISENLYEPHPLSTSAVFSKEVNHEIAITQQALPRKPITDPLTSPVIPKGDVLLPDQKAKAMQWRYNTSIGTMGPNNSGTFTEFDTQELIDRRLKQISENGINTVLLNGLLSRLTYPEQLDRVEKNIKDIAATGHKLNMKIMDHQDLSLLWNMGSGFRVMCEKLGMTQRTVDGNLPTRGFCLTNREFSDFYFDWITSFIEETNIDGLMIDEACYHGANFCGCADCRGKFTTDTGLTLPLDETSPLLQNKDSKLWKAWLSWRLKAVGDWGVELRRRIMPSKPYFTFMQYTTHSGFSNTYASLEHGADLTEGGRSRDFLGTEIMSRNVMAAHRSVFSFRKAKNALREAHGSPIFGLVYPLNSSNFAYFGWAMNNMNAQVTWLMGGRKNRKNDYPSFKDNMDRSLAKPVSDIAVFYSVKSRDWAKYMSTRPETLGLSQAFTDRHIMHDFFIEKSISDEFLKKYRVVVLPSSVCISRENIELFLKFARDGGTLYLTAAAGLLDQMGNSHSSWPFAEVFGLRPPNEVIKTRKAAKFSFAGKAPVDSRKYVIGMNLDPNSPSEVIAEALSAEGKVIQPLALERKYGTGRIIYCASQLSGANYEKEHTYKDKWDFSMNETINAFNGELLEKVIGTKSLAFTPVAIPKQVLVSVYRQTNKEGTSTMVHLLNASGVKKMEIGQIVPGEIPEPAWPGIDKNIAFEISLPSFKQAYIVSPDFEGRKVLKTKKLSGDRYHVIIPKNLLKKYSIVFLNH